MYSTWMRCLLLDHAAYHSAGSAASNASARLFFGVSTCDTSLKIPLAGINQIIPTYENPIQQFKPCTGERGLVYYQMVIQLSSINSGNSQIPSISTQQRRKNHSFLQQKGQQSQQSKLKQAFATLCW